MRNVTVKRLQRPFPHYLVVGSQKKLHGWYNSRYRECTAERLIVNPYCGCRIGCFYCYARALPGYFFDAHRHNSVYVFKDFDRQVRKQLETLSYASCGYLSAVSDPFQRINGHYRLSEKVIRVFMDCNLPIEFVTKQRVPAEVIRMLAGQADSFGQVSILTSRESLRRKLAPGGATTEVLLENIRRMRAAGLYAVARIDPILPFITDDRDSLRLLLDDLVKAGASHIVVSVLDIPVKIRSWICAAIRKAWGSELIEKYRGLYTDHIGTLQASYAYREDLFSFLRDEASKRGLTFALCMEFKKEGASIKGLNCEFSTAYNCEGKDVPLYKRNGSRFYPISGCRGNCLYCERPVCGLSRFDHQSGNTSYALTLKDYRCVADS